MKILDTPFEWHSADVELNESWRIDLSEDEVSEVLLHVNNSEILCFEHNPSVAESLAPLVSKITSALCEKFGFCILRGLKLGQFSCNELTHAFLQLGLCLGKLWPQNSNGDWITDVTAGNGRRGINQSGGDKFTFHSDVGDILAFMCLQDAYEGGESQLVSSIAIHNDLVRSGNKLVAELYQNLPFDARGEEKNGYDPWYLLPIYNVLGENLYTHFVSSYIFSSQNYPGAPVLSSRTVEAIELLADRTERPEYQFTFRMNPGDIIFVNNYKNLHSRKLYVDSVDKVRHLKRIWLKSNLIDNRPDVYLNHPVHPFNC